MNVRQGIPFRPSPEARREETLASIAEACLHLVRTQDSAKPRGRLDAIGELVLRSPTSPTTIAGASSLAHLSVRFIEALSATSTSAAVISRSLQLSFDGATQISVPGLTIPAAAWTGEGQPIGVQAGTTSAGASLSPYKLAVITVLSHEMLVASDAATMVKTLLLENIGPTLDTLLFSTTAGVAGKSPPGILNGITPITASSSSGLAAMVADIGAIAAALAPFSGGSSPVLILPPAQFVSINMYPLSTVFDVFMSPALASGTVMGLVPAALATAVEAPRLEQVDMAQLHMEQLAAELVSSPGVVAAPQRSLFQTDTSAVRLILAASWALRSASAVAVVNSVKW
jgi:hypothetical protein